MWELFHILPLLIGDDFPDDDDHYHCFLQLQSIATILFSSTVAMDQVPFLRLQIQEYLQNVKYIYPHYDLPPKSHYLVHVPSLINR